jgi:NAD(P)H-hydrate epimerase
MARLLNSSVAAVQADRLNVAMRAAGDWGQVIVLKGAHTITAAPDGRAIINPHANPLLAAAGTGDVLAGVIASLVAQDMPLFEAAACGVFIHGSAAAEMAVTFGDRGLLASELAAAVPRAIRTIREGQRLAGPARNSFASLAALARMREFGGPGSDA